MVKYLKDGSALISALEGDVNVESDCEGDSTVASDGTPKEEWEESRAVLIAGSFSACVRFLAPSGSREMTKSPDGDLYSSIAVQA